MRVHHTSRDIPGVIESLVGRSRKRRWDRPQFFTKRACLNKPSLELLLSAIITVITLFLFVRASVLATGAAGMNSSPVLYVYVVWRQHTVAPGWARSDCNRNVTAGFELEMATRLNGLC